MFLNYSSPSCRSEQAPVSLIPKFYAREILNSRTAMVGFIAALAAELSTHETVLSQLNFQKHASDTFWLVSVIGLVFLSSQFPVWNNSKADGLNQKAKANGPFTPMAEIINGRAAMIGFASLIFTEALKGSSVF